MEKERRIKTISVIALVVAVLGLTVAFAVLSTNLVINGTAKVDPGKWDIHFENLLDATIKGKAKEENKPKINESQTTKIEDINVTLTQPKDEVIYKVDLVNKGDIDAEISSINLPDFNEEEQKYIEFNATYDSDKKVITNGDVLKGNTTEKVTISIKFKEDVTELPSEDLNATLSYEINYVQTDQKVENNIHKGEANVPKINYEGLNQGDIVKLGDEEFYVIENGETELKLLAKYNLLVGNIVTWSGIGLWHYMDPVEVKLIDPKTHGYGRQSSDAIGANSDDVKWVGAIGFEEYDESKVDYINLAYKGYYAYWRDRETKKLLTKYGNEYPAYVYDSNSKLYDYVEDYKKYLSDELGYKNIEARLITHEEVMKLGCGKYDEYNYDCKNAQPWVYSTSYWTGSADEDGYVFNIASEEAWYGRTLCYDDEWSGIRPVIVMTK